MSDETEKRDKTETKPPVAAPEGGAASPRVFIVGLGQSGRELLWRLMSEMPVIGLDLVEKKVTQTMVRIKPPAEAVMRDGTSRLVWRDLGLLPSDIVVTMTRRDEVNLEACRVAREDFQVRRLFSVTHSGSRESEYAAAGIETVCRSLVLANHLASRVLRDRRTASDVGLGLGEIIEVPILPGSTVIGRPLRAFHAHPWLVAAIYRQDKLIVPHGDTVIQAGDRVVLVGEPHVLAAIADFFKMGEPEFPLRFGRRFGLLHAGGRKPELDAAIAETGYLAKNTKADGVTLLAVNGQAPAIPPDANRACGGELRCETAPLSERRENWIGELQGRDFGALILPAPRFFIWQRLGITPSLLSSALASSAMPVLVSRGSHPYKKILAPVALRSSPLQVAELAIDLARLLGASLSAITVTEPSFAAGSETVSEQKQILDQLQEMSSLYRLPIELLHREGNPIAEIVAEAKNYDLLVLGHRRSSRRRFRIDIALEIAARVRSSVLILPNEGEIE